MNGIVNLLDSILNVNKPEVISENKMIIRKRNLTIEFYFQMEIDAVEMYFIKSNQLVDVCPIWLSYKDYPQVYEKAKDLFLTASENKSNDNVRNFLCEFIS